MGLWIQYQSAGGLTTPLQLQVSFIFIGIRFFDASQYPSQNAFTSDTFSAYSIKNSMAATDFEP